MIDVNNLHVYFGSGLSRFEAVKGVTFNVQQGETYGLVGESGSGKSTILNAIAGRHGDWTGSISLGGEAVTGKHRTREQRLLAQIVFQDPYGSIHPKHTIGSTLAEPLEINNRNNIDGTIETLLGKVRLPAAFRYRYPHQISGGQRQRVSIARALALESPVILLDEPTSALDVSVQAEILNLLQDLKEQQGLTYLMVSHDMGVVAHMCDRIGVMQSGGLIDEVDRSQLLAGTRLHSYTRNLRDASLGFV